MTPRVLAAAVLVAFTAYSLWVVATFGLGGFLGWVFHNAATLQVFFDLCIALTLALLAITADARRRSVASWPYWILAVLTGSIGALAYWALHGATPVATHRRVSTALSCDSVTAGQRDSGTL